MSNLPIFISPVARSVPFDNSTNGFVATNVQTAIEEATTTITGRMFSAQFNGQGTIVNDWLDIPGDTVISRDTPFEIPWACNLVGFSFSNELVRSTTLEIYRAATGVEPNVGTRVLTFAITNARACRSTDFTPVAFAAGDKVAFYARANGGGPRNVAASLFFIITSPTSSTTKDTTTTVFTPAGAAGGTTVTI